MPRPAIARCAPWCTKIDDGGAPWRILRVMRLKHYEDLLVEALHDPDSTSLRALHEARARGSEAAAMQAEVVMLQKQVAALQRTLALLASAVVEGGVEGGELRKRLLAAPRGPSGAASTPT